MCAAVWLLPSLSNQAAEGQRPLGIPVITIDKERMCPLVDGKPFFAIGCCGIPEASMKEAAEAGFNLTIRWGCYQHREFKQAMDRSGDAVRTFVCSDLDAAREAGLWVMDWPAVFGGVATGGDLANPSFRDYFRRKAPGSIPVLSPSDTS
jgi:hypothetical protein